jgi:hypothetical protein
MQLQILQDTPTVSVYYDSTNDWLFADWRGELDLALVQAGCLTIAQCFLHRTYPRILNNNTDVKGMSANVSAWLAHDYLPHLGLAGIEYLAWVCAPSLLLKHLTSEAVRQLRSPTVAIFDDLADGYAWLQHTRFQHLDHAMPQSPAERQAELASRVAAFSAELQHYQKVSKRVAAPRKMP